MNRKKLPVGIDDYKKLIDENYYYVDKTLFIKELLDYFAEVNLFTRPRRFGKTLNLSMLQYFFEKPVDGSDNAYLFDGKKIKEAGEMYFGFQGKYPVVRLSLKSGKQPDYGMSYASLVEEIGREYRRHEYILSGDSLSAAEQSKYRCIMEGKAEAVEYAKSLLFLSECLAKHEQQKVIILIDEYDVPLENAYYQGFYPEMISFIRSLFESVLKTNSALKFAVMTGCLRISRESIFTGLNNLRVISILNIDYGEYFGFVQGEVDEMLAYYHMEEKRTLIKEWYDGYIFGKAEVYNPWSMVNFVSDHLKDMEVFPIEYWSNTSSNSIIRDLIVRAGSSVKNELEALIGGGSIEKVIHEDITYQNIYESEENLWNFLFFTGYLKAVEVKFVDDDRIAVLQIPNREVKKIYRQQIIHWMEQTFRMKDLSVLFEAVVAGDADRIQKELAPLFANSISYMDSYENFYHGFLLGLFVDLDGYRVTSNREAGDGRYDISLERLDGLREPIILELKIAARKTELERAAKTALEQILDKRYDAPFQEEGYSQCIHIGIGFYKKMCQVACERIDLNLLHKKSKQNMEFAHTDKIQALRQELEQSETVIIGAGAGLSTAAGFTYGGERFRAYFKDFAEKYHFKDMYEGGFYPYETLNEHWAYWSRNIYVNRYMNAPKPLYQELYGLVRNKDYFVLTTNVDHCFQKAGFDKKRLFYTQGDYGLCQCSEPCHGETYDNAEIIYEMVQSQGWQIGEDNSICLPDDVTAKMIVPDELIPYCPKCGKPMSMNLRADDTFVQDEGWYNAAKRYELFLRKHKDTKTLFLELGVGYNTPGIIKYPFWNMVNDWENATYACLNMGEVIVPEEIKHKSICVNDDINTLINMIKGA